MDPYLERHWRSVHQRLITYAGDQLQPQLPRRFRVEVEERVFVVGSPEHARTLVPDVSVVDRASSKRPEVPPSGGSTIVEPVVIELTDEPITETFLEIIDTSSGNAVTTAIELLSPTNKTPGDGNDLYLKKQQDYRRAGVSQVEIDLTRAGDRGLVFPMALIPREHRTVYLACVRRSWQPSRIEAYPLPLRQPLPTIGIPLAAEEADVALNLQSLVDACYRNGRYDDIDYRQDLQPPLSPEDAAWADTLLKQKGVR
jgi:hypothetical protein